MNRELNQREKTLLGIAVVLLGLLAAWLLNHVYGSEVGTIIKRRDQLRENADFLENATKSGALVRRMNAYGQRSLPSDRFRAASQYQNWLLVDLASRSGLRDPKVEQPTVRDVKEGYRSYAFTFRAKGTLGQLAEFTRIFQQYDNLHSIRTITLKPSKDAKELEVSVTIDALALFQSEDRPFSTHLREPAPDVNAERAMVQSIVARNFFADYVPPRQDDGQRRPEPPRTIDPTPYCFVTGVAEAFGKPQAWIVHRLTGKTDRIHIGDRFDVGEMPCILRSVDFAPRAITVEADGGLYRIALGESFDDAEYLGDVEEPEPEDKRASADGHDVAR